MAQPPPPQNPDLTRELTNTSARLRLLEERIINLRRKLQVTEQNMVAAHRSNTEDLHLVKDDIMSLKNEITDMKNTTRTVVSELDSFAKHEDVLTIQKYLAYWEPMRFVSEDQVEKIVHRILDENKPS